MFLFPYEAIKKDSSIILYGAGTVGNDYVRQISNTNYCKIICALDRNPEDKTGFPVKVCAPEEILKISSNTYETVLICLQDALHSKECEKRLIELGVPKSKILQSQNVSVNALGFLPNPIYTTKDDNPNILKLSFYAYGGMGDSLFAANLANAIKQTVGENAQIDFYCLFPGVFYGLPFMNNIRKLQEYNSVNDYDAAIFIYRNANFEKINLDKVKRFSETLYNWCLGEMRINKEVCGNMRDDFRHSAYAAFKGKNREEQCNINGILPLDRHSPTYMNWEWDSESKKFFSDFSLESRLYITISTGIENCNTTNNPKLWPVEYYNKLVSLIKTKYPQLTIVNIGQNHNFGKIENTDIDLVGKTTLSDLKTVLKNSLLHIGVEGGLVHLNHFLDGKSCCLYGPVSISFFGYEENINLQSREIPKQCLNGCEGVTVAPNWMAYGCLIDKEPICMKTLYPEYIFERISEYLDFIIKEKRI